MGTAILVAAALSGLAGPAASVPAPSADVQAQSTVVAHPPPTPEMHSLSVGAASNRDIGRAGPISPFPPLQPMPYPPSHWHDGYWYYGNHAHRGGWWWVVGDIWFGFVVPIYPYPDPYIPPAMAVPQPPLRYWYWCQHPQGYYPYVSQCELPWQPIPAVPPPPPPPR